jgi:hypothetical protein
MTAQRGLGVALMAPVGAWLAHALMHQVTHDRHSLSSLLTVILITAVIAGIAVQPGQRSGLLPFHSIPQLAGAQMALFLLQELVEHLLAGQGATGILADPALLTGLAMQLVIAALLISLLRVACHVVAAWSRESVTGARVAETARPAVVVIRPVSCPAGHPVSRRGPPMA